MTSMTELESQLLSALQAAVEAECTLADYQPEWEEQARAAIKAATEEVES